MNAVEAYLLARAYTNKALEGAGALKGAACQVKSITSITGGHRVTFEWEDDEGETSTDYMDVMDGTDGDDGVGIASITYKETDVSGNYVYTVTLTDSNSYDITCPKGPAGATGQTGATGNGIASIEKTSTSGLVDTYTITYTNGTTSTFTVTNGQNGENEFIGTTAEWNALTTAQKKEYDTYQLTDDYTEESGGLPDYSTTEQKNGQKWIDGKDIYVKTLATPISITANDQWIATGLNGIDSLIDYTIRLTRDVEQVGSSFNSGYIDVVVRDNTLNVKGHNMTITDLYVISSMTVYYTKTA